MPDWKSPSQEFWEERRREEEQDEDRKRPGLFSAFLEGADPVQSAGDSAVRRIAGDGDKVGVVNGVVKLDGRPLAHAEVAILAGGQLVWSRTNEHGVYSLQITLGHAKLLVMVPGRGTPVSAEILCLGWDTRVEHEVEVDAASGAARLVAR